MKFRKRPVVIEAMQFNGASTGQLFKFCQTARHGIGPNLLPYLTIPTLEGDHRASVGDWIIKGVKGEFYPCKPDIFAATYEPAAEAP
jgi:hypothetical protein